MSAALSKTAIAFEIETLLGALNKDSSQIDFYKQEMRSIDLDSEADYRVDQDSDVENRFAILIAEAMAKSNRHLDDGSS